MVAPLAEELNARAPTVFVLEDLHWADEATLDVFRLLVRRIERIPALVIGSYRDDGLELAHPLRIVLGELATSRSISRLRLTGLTPPAVAELAQPYGADPDELYDKSGGNPFFVVEALAAGVEAIPETVRDAVLARAARLTPAGRAALETVSIVPPQAELWLLGALAGDPVRGLGQCLVSGMLRWEGAGVVFRHELARLAVEDSVPPQRRLELHGRHRRGHPDRRGGARAPARPGPEARGGGPAVLAVGDPLVSRPNGRFQPRGSRGGRAARDAAAEPGARVRLLEARLASGRPQPRALAEQLADTELTIRARAVVGTREFGNRGSRSLEECFELARNAGLIDLAGLVLSFLVSSALAARRYELASRYIDLGLPFCSDRGIELYRSYLLAYRARLELDQGRWEAAAEAATAVLRTQRASIMPRILGLVVLGLVRARRGDPGHQDLLDEAWSLAAPTRELFRMGPAVSARAEARWLAGDHAAVASATEDLLRKAVKHGDRNVIGELAVWRRRAGFDDDVASAATEPYAAQLAGEWASAAAFWDEAGCPYDAALARADSGDEKQLRHALDELQRLGARPAAAIVASRLRKRGARGLPRGPATRDAREPGGPDSAAARGARPGGRGPAGLGDRGAAGRVRADGRSSRRRHPAEARGRQSRPGSGRSRPPRARLAR